jgi:DNA ligase (NAD+)
MVKFTKAFITSLEKSPMDILKSMTIDDVVSLIQKANHAYYNIGKPMLRDQIFDIVKTHLEELQPNHPALKNVGTKVHHGAKAVLPVFMGSLDKIKSDEKVFTSWKALFTGSYVISDKLDGNSGLLHSVPGQATKLYTRGNGVEGQDVSHLLPFLKNSKALHNLSTMKDTMSVRGELIISKADWEGYVNKQNKGANARNTVAGLLNSVIPDLNVARITSFVAYELILPSLPPAKQMSFITDKLGIDVVHHNVWNTQDMTLEHLSNELVQRRKTSPYEIDGIVVVHNDVHDRIMQNPDYAFAFKSVITMDKAEVIVSKVEWNMSKDGVFVPVVHFTPIQLDGVIITKAHGFNAKYIKDNSLGAGAIIIVMRSGAVIPYIVETVVQAPNPHMPEVPYRWSKTGVDIVVTETENNEELKLRNLQYFFEKIDVRGLSSGIVKRLHEAGFITVGSILHINMDGLLEVNGVKSTLATKLLEAIQQRLKTLDMYTVMDASNVLGRGFGVKKIKLICEAFPRIVNEKYVPSLQELISIKGVEETTANRFITNLPSFFKFMNDNNIEINENKSHRDVASVSSSKYGADYVTGKTFVFSGVRDKELEAFIETHGGKVASSVTKNTSIVVVKATDVESAKTAKAKSLHIPLMLILDFQNEIAR